MPQLQKKSPKQPTIEEWEKTRITIPRHSQPGILLPGLSDGLPFVRYATKRTPEPYQIQLWSIICERHRAVLKKTACSTGNRLFKSHIAVQKQRYKEYYSITTLRLPAAVTTTYTPFESAGIKSFAPPYIFTPAML